MEQKIEQKIEQNNEQNKNVMVREDLNDMVKSINFKTISNKFGERHVVEVRLFNGKVLEFKDDKKLFEICMSFRDIGDENFLKSKKLVEELNVNEDGEILGTYICVRYELCDGTKVVLFASDSFSTRKILDNYYKQFKELRKSETAKK